MNTLIMDAIHTDPIAASNMINAIPAGENRDRTIQNFVDRKYNSKPDLAWKVAQTMSNQDMQYMAMENIARNWLQFYNSDKRAEARTAVQASNLPQAAKNRLLKTN